MRNLLRMIVLLPGAALFLPLAVEAQTGPPPPARDSVSLQAEREIFAYPTLDRRNPFKPLTGAGSGPRFEQMRLGGIIYSATPGRSVALLSTGVGSQQAAAPGLPRGESRGQSAQLRVGERWGNVRVVEIRPDRVIVEVEEFGLAERREMRLQNPSRGGS